MHMRVIVSGLLLFGLLLSLNHMAVAHSPEAQEALIAELEAKEALSGEEKSTPLQFNMPEGVTENSRIAFSLHMIMFWACVAIGVVVFGIMFYAMIFHRKARGAKASNFHESTVLEIVWTIIPFVILIGMAIPATVGIKKMYDTDNADIDIKVTGHRWFWEYEYVGTGVKFLSNLSTPEDQWRLDQGTPTNENYLLEVDNPLVLPTNKKVRFIVSSNDVIHSWWVPELGVKRDAIPGFAEASWMKTDKPNIYRGVCTELCGDLHGYMPIVVDVRTEDDYESWLAERKVEAEEERKLTEKTFTLDELVARGKKIYDAQCLACHGANGEGGAGKPIAGSAIVLGPKEGHLDLLANGSSNGLMRPYKDLLSDTDMAAVLTFQRNSFGNSTGDMIQPVDVLKFKRQQ